jgi:hypothetical protein
MLYSKWFVYIPPVLVVWRPTTSQTGAFATDIGLFMDSVVSRMYSKW